MATTKTVRTRALESVAKKGAMTATEIATAIGLGHGLKPTMDQEVERGHLRLVNGGDNAGTTYDITAKGRAALKNGTVDPVRGAGTNGKSTKPAKKAKKATTTKKASKAKPAPAVEPATV